MFLIDNILTAPAKGFMNILKVIYDEAYNELYDPEKIRQELMELHLKLDSGEITEEAYEVAEEVLLDRLDQIRE
ncbi:MAG: gas vesicle protein GvpG [Bacteroidota bacterium]